MTKKAPWNITELEEKDVPQIRDLFYKIFGHEMSEQLWDWKYGNKRGQAILAWDNGQLVGHYGGIARSFITQGQRIKSMQPCDVMVLPEYRKKGGPFPEITATFVGLYTGKNTDTLLFGFPNENAMKAGKRTGIYNDVADVFQLQWNTSVSTFSPFLRCQRLTCDNIIHQDIDILWSKMHSSLDSKTIIGIRDAQYVEHRYLNHPTNQYDVFLISNRFTRKNNAIIVLQRQEQRCLLLDVICPLEQIPIVINQARKLTRLWGKQELYTWITDTFVDTFEKHVQTKTILDFQVAATGLPLDQLRNCWWLMPGDTDYL